jgi:ABC-type multidrug transport system ATPase subunit/pSer/pThr/pTyr-binding forkhead associated (FHA) protein
LHAGRRIPIETPGIGIGRGEGSDLLLSGERISRRHARVHANEAGEFWLIDLGSQHGTWLNGEHLIDDTRRLSSGDTISFDGEVVRFVMGEETRIASRALPIVGTQLVRFDEHRLTIGRDPSNDVVLDDPNVSRFHAEVRAEDGRIEIVDLGSRNGTRLDGESIERSSLETGTEIGVGPFALIFDGTSFVARDERGALRLDCDRVCVEVKEKQILAPTTIAVEPGEFVAIIGESGSGKSTLVKTLAGVATPSSGRVTVSGEPVLSRLTDIGYVPQDDIVHSLLTVSEALRYAARLRLPQDTSDQEIESVVARVLDELALTEHADTRIGSLSGGQRKRTSVAAELLSRPSLLFLDEPTTGLDPGLETKMMELLRELASGGRTVVVVTHATKNLRLCDKVAVMGRGGELTFWGAPQGALEFFEATDFDEIYSALEEHPSVEWRRRFRSQVPARMPGEMEETRGRDYQRQGGRGVLRQAGVLTERYLRLTLRDHRNLALLVGQAPLLALLNVIVFQSSVFDRPGGSAGDAVQLLFLLVIGMTWLGTIDAAPEIVKERSVFQRESAIGTRLSAYLISKVSVLFALVAVQTLLFTAVVVLLRPLDAPTSAYMEVFVLLLLTGFVAVGMGLLISAAVGTQDQAMSFSPLALIPQLLFAGAIVPIARMNEPIQSLSSLMFAQWSFAGVGSSLDMNVRIAQDPQFSRAGRFDDSFFDVAFGTGLLVLLAFLAVFLVATTLVLRRRLRT